MSVHFPQIMEYKKHGLEKVIYFYAPKVKIKESEFPNLCFLMGN